MLFQSLRHENLVNLIEVFRRKKRLYLVFEFVDNTILDELERYPNGLDEGYIRKILWQTLRGTEFCHSHNVSIRSGLNIGVLQIHLFNKKIGWITESYRCRANTIGIVDLAILTVTPNLLHLIPVNITSSS